MILKRYILFIWCNKNEQTYEISFVSRKTNIYIFLLCTKNDAVIQSLFVVLCTSKRQMFSFLCGEKEGTLVLYCVLIKHNYYQNVPLSLIFLSKYYPLFLFSTKHN